MGDLVKRRNRLRWYTRIKSVCAVLILASLLAFAVLAIVASFNYATMFVCCGVMLVALCVFGLADHLESRMKKQLAKEWMKQ